MTLIHPPSGLGLGLGLGWVVDVGVLGGVGCGCWGVGWGVDVGVLGWVGWVVDVG